jgi:hypothetical protein
MSDKYDVWIEFQPSDDDLTYSKLIRYDLINGFYSTVNEDGSPELGIYVVDFEREIIFWRTPITSSNTLKEVSYELISELRSKIRDYYSGSNNPDYQDVLILNITEMADEIFSNFQKLEKLSKNVKKAFSEYSGEQ